MRMNLIVFFRLNALINIETYFASVIPKPNVCVSFGRYFGHCEEFMLFDTENNKTILENRQHIVMIELLPWRESRVLDQEDFHPLQGIFEKQAWEQLCL